MTKEQVIELVRLYARDHSFEVSSVLNVIGPGENRYATGGERRLWSVCMKKDLPWNVAETPGYISFLVNPKTGEVTLGDAI